MKQARADHATLYYRERIYVFGGMAARADGTVESLNSCEVYSIKDDAWSELPPMSEAR
jgi:N-acetylneuraminic acid mutarotase